MGEMIFRQRIETISLTGEVVFMDDDCHLRLPRRSLRSRGRRGRWQACLTSLDFEIAEREISSETMEEGKVSWWDIRGLDDS